MQRLRKDGRHQKSRAAAALNPDSGSSRWNVYSDLLHAIYTLKKDTKLQTVYTMETIRLKGLNSEEQY